MEGVCLRRTSYVNPSWLRASCYWLWLTLLSTPLVERTGSESEEAPLQWVICCFRGLKGPSSWWRLATTSCFAPFPFFVLLCVSEEDLLASGPISKEWGMRVRVWDMDAVRWVGCRGRVTNVVHKLHIRHHNSLAEAHISGGRSPNTQLLLFLAWHPEKITESMARRIMCTAIVYFYIGRHFDRECLSPNGDLCLLMHFWQLAPIKATLSFNV